MSEMKNKRKEWKVYFSGNLWGHEKGERCGREIPVGKTFRWGEEKWLVPSVYSTSSGLVMDFCVEIEPDHIRTFMKKWNLWDGEPEVLEENEQNQMEAENPLNLSVFPKVYLNERELLEDHGCSVTWNPCIPEISRSREEARAYSVPEAEQFLEHYGYDSSKGWIFKRYAFRWGTKRKPAFREMKIKLKREPDCFLGKHFTVESPGQEIVFSHPITGITHTLTVIGFTQEKLEEVSFDDDMEWPQYYSRLEYALSPELPAGEFTVQDCDRGDSPRQNQKKAAAITVIGGTSGPTSVFIAGECKRSAHTAFSSLHFKAADTVEWRMVFHVKMAEDIVVKLL